jgi:hypothetical protein
LAGRYEERWAGLRATPPEGAKGKFPRGPEPDTASLRSAGVSSAAVAGCVPGDLMPPPAWRGEEAPAAFSPHRLQPLDSVLFPRRGHLPSSLC